jgi:hypothetical protein
LGNLDNTGAGIATDLDGDGDPDFVLTPKYARPGGEPAQNLKFYRNQVPNGGMFQKIECDTTFDFVTCAAADFDNDGDSVAPLRGVSTPSPRSLPANKNTLSPYPISW